MDNIYTTKELVHINRDTGLSVFKATLPSGLTICVKEQHVKELTSSSLQKSLAAQQRLKHVNICAVLRIEVSSGEEACVRGELFWMDS
jgi:predicted thioesterase